MALTKIEVSSISDDAISTAKIADDAITLAKLAAGTDGELITWDAAGNPAAVPVGTSTHVLTSNGTGAAPTFQEAGGGGAWTLISSQTASNSASLDVTGLTSTYGTYAFACSDIVPISAGAQLGIRIGDSGGFDSGASDYGHHISTLTDVTSPTTYTGVSLAGQSYIRCGSSVNTGTNSCSVVGYVSNGFDGTNLCYAHGTYCNNNTGADFTGGHWFGGRLSVITVDRIQLVFSTGNISAGRFTVWGIAHA
jgi:hypothetical protein